ncbi:MAG: hypothetical protein P8J34_02980 [Flavobacteriales bacterium]|nr:hypothetical protein [Flavobacteriales bacterium]
MKTKTIRKTLIMGILFSTIIIATAQNTAQKIIGSNQGLHIGGYGQIDYNRTINNDLNYNAKLDVHRLVTFLGYNFNEKTSFVSELEFEHVVEVYVEQAFLSHNIRDNFSINAGLMLIPMGIQNLYHEPPTFNGVERTNIDKYIVPTTWREMGASVNGRIMDNTLSYELMLVNGFNGYDGEGVFTGNKGLRSGRQKGAESYMTAPDFASRFSYVGIPNLNLGLSTYFGESESTAYNGLDLSDKNAVASADSTIIGINMMGIDGRYQKGALQLRGQYIVADLSNTNQYNTFTGKDLGSKMLGYYAEAGYNLLSEKETNNELIAFARYENYNTHKEVEEGGISINSNYDRKDVIIGLGLKLAKGAMFKIDYQIQSNGNSNPRTDQINIGTAVWF